MCQVCVKKTAYLCTRIAQHASSRHWTAIGLPLDCTPARMPCLVARASLSYLMHYSQSSVLKHASERLERQLARRHAQGLHDLFTLAHSLLLNNAPLRRHHYHSGHRGNAVSRPLPLSPYYCVSLAGPSRPQRCSHARQPARHGHSTGVRHVTQHLCGVRQ